VNFFLHTWFQLVWCFLFFGGCVARAAATPGTAEAVTAAKITYAFVPPPQYKVRGFHLIKIFSFFDTLQYMKERNIAFYAKAHSLLSAERMQGFKVCVFFCSIFRFRWALNISLATVDCLGRLPPCLLFCVPSVNFFLI
jgi:hypothetical protein